MALDIPRNKELAEDKDAHRRPATVHGIKNSVQGIVGKAMSAILRHKVRPKLLAFYLPHFCWKKHRQVLPLFRMIIICGSLLWISNIASNSSKGSCNPQTPPGNRRVSLFYGSLWRRACLTTFRDCLCGIIVDKRSDSFEHLLH